MSLDFSLTASINCPHCNKPVDSERVIYDFNITHNLTQMASEVDLYKVLWRPDENGHVYARDIITPLNVGLTSLKERPSFFQKFNPDNGWGSYDGFVSFVEKVLVACETHPDAFIHVSR